MLESVAERNPPACAGALLVLPIARREVVAQLLGHWLTPGPDLRRGLAGWSGGATKPTRDLERVSEFEAMGEHEAVGSGFDLAARDLAGAVVCRRPRGRPLEVVVINERAMRRRASSSPAKIACSTHSRSKWFARRITPLDPLHRRKRFDWSPVLGTPS